jgi:hypothetical protein
MGVALGLFDLPHPVKELKKAIPIKVEISS